MVPTRAKSFVEVVGKELGIDPELVNDVVDLYWSTLRRTMERGNHGYVTLHQFGIFKLKPVTITKDIEYLKGEVDFWSDNPKVFRLKLKEMKMTLEYLIKIRKLIDNDKVKAKEHRIKREAWKAEFKIKTGLGK